MKPIAPRSALVALLLAGPLCAADPGPVEMRLDAGSLRVSAGARQVLDYRLGVGAGASYKSYVAGLYLPTGLNPLRDSPHDHVHHHALMLAFNVDGVEFWGVEDRNCGRQVHRGLAEVQGPTGQPEGAVDFTERLEWRAPESPDPASPAAAVAGKVLLLEERRLAVRPPRSGEPAVLDWASIFRLPPGRGTARLTGREYHGLGVRFLIPMDKSGKFTNADGGTGVAGTNKKRSRWCAYAASPEGEGQGGKVTVALFDDPRNPRRPADWFTMDSGFAYMTLTLGLDEEPLDLPEGKELKLRYGAALFEGDAGPAAIEAAHAAWLAARR